MLSRTLISAALIAAFTIPAAAQDIPDPMEPPPAANDDMAADAMTPEQAAQYASWPEEVRDYYDTLSPERQALFWQMDDADKVSLASMSAEDQEAVWQGIESLPQNGIMPEGAE